MPEFTVTLRYRRMLEQSWPIQKLTTLRLLIALLLTITLTCLTACKEDEKDKQLKTYIEKVQKTPPGPIEPIPQFRGITHYNYPPKPQRNPFAPYVSNRSMPSHIAHHKNRPKQRLEAFPIDALNMVGVLKKKNKLWALISAPNGIVYKIKKGDYIGRHYGQVIEINSTFIKFKEIRLMGREWKSHIVKMVLVKKQ